MDRTADLEAAQRFVSGRIAEQATLWGEPLNDEQRLLLNYMPSSPVVFFDPETRLVPRNINYERLCALAKAAYLNDRKINPESLDWEFAFAVFRLNRHPMWGVLHSAWVKMYRRPLWNQIFVIIAGLFPLIAVILLASNGPRTLFQRAVILCGTVTIMLLIYFFSRQIEQWQLENHIERCRLASRNISWKTS